MIESNIINSIRGYIQQGYTKQQIIDYLIKFGYNPQDVNETYDYVQANPPVQEPQPEQQPEQPKPAPKPKSKMLIPAIIIIAVILIGTGTAFFVMTRPVCGNGEVEKGETQLTCCEDTGCLGEQTCENSACVNPICGECEYLNNNACVAYECCENDDCAENEECTDKNCETILCESCQYTEDHQCINYSCCQDSECYEGESCVDNECIQPCGTCQYRVNGICEDYECCDDNACASTEECEDNFCAALFCSSGQIAQNHECVSVESCSSDANCDDNLSNTTDICIGAGTSTAHCLHTERGECDTNSDCDDDDELTEDICAGSPKSCSNPKYECEDIGVECTASYGTCNETLIEALDTNYCCIGICTENADLYIDSLDEDNVQLEVVIGGIDTVNSTTVFKIYAFENGTRMDTESGSQYHTINGKNATDTFYFNFTLSNITINVSAFVDYDDVVDETNETNNNITEEVNLS